MKRSRRLGLVVVIGLICSIFAANSQVLVESVAAIVGNEVVYLSDVENGVLDARRGDNKTPLDEIRCRVFQELLIAKLFVDQARIDSIVVTDDAVEGDLNMRINDAIRQIGSEKALA
jgi:peptidyl-prolyl cis-trans isomerase SurA